MRCRVGESAAGRGDSFCCQAGEWEAVAEWVRALDWRPYGPGLESCWHHFIGLRKMRESARNDISRTHANFARAHKCEQNTAYDIHTRYHTL